MQTNKMTYVHCAVVFVLAFFFRFLPPIGQVTPYGMGILGTFIAAIYGWSTIGMVWPSFICLTAIGLTIGPNQMIAAYNLSNDFCILTDGFVRRNRCYYMVSEYYFR